MNRSSTGSALPVKARPSRTHWLFGIVSMLTGSALVLGTVVFMNELSKPPERDEAAERKTTIDVRQPPEDEPPPPPKPTISGTAKQSAGAVQGPPLPTITGVQAGIGSLDLALPSLQVADLSGAAGELLETKEESVVHTSETVDEAPRPVERPPMDYPPRLRDQGVEGSVTLSILVDAEGNVERVKVLEAEPPGVFEDVARRSVEEWRFQPATYQGKPVRTWARQTVRFELRGR